MICNDEELKVMREQLGRAERALASLRSEITNERNFAVFSEAYVDQIAELKAEIDAYQKAAKKKTVKRMARPRNRRGRNPTGDCDAPPVPRNGVSRKCVPKQEFGNEVNL